jgi:DNA polymerase-3 subunit epsilon
MNVSIHGISECDVQSSPVWSELHSSLSLVLRGQISVCHTAFDRVSTTRACERYSLPAFETEWLDSARVVRRAWRAFSRSGYGLSNIAAHLGITYKGHNACEDARCAGEVLLRAIADTGRSVNEWVTRARQPLDPCILGPVLRPGDPEGPLYGEVLVFIGTLSLRRSDAADLASSAGCEVDARVTERTSLLVVGDQDFRKLAGHDKSAKHRKAEELISKGQKIRILGETDFQKIVEQPLLSCAP